MTINKFQGKTKEEAIENARREYGPGAVIMNVKEIKPKGIFKMFSGSTYEVTAAKEEKEEKVNPLSALMKSGKAAGNESINLAADEEINIPRPGRQTDYRTTAGAYSGLPRTTNLRGADRMSSPTEEPQERISRKLSGGNNIEERLDNLSSMLEERLGVSRREEQQQPVKKAAPTTEELSFLRILYRTLVDNGVHEKYVNQIMDEVEKLVRPGKSVDTILANVYQKLILRFGQPKTIETGGRKPRVIFFIGPTGVGKTTTIAKIASGYKVEQARKVAFCTADTYRIAATEQLRVYANILDAPMEIVYEVEDLNNSVRRMAGYDMIFVDTAGFSHKNGVQKEDIKRLLQGLDPAFDREVYLVLSATTKYQDLLDIVDTYREITDFRLIFTKLDETSSYGNILNIRLYSGADLSYAATGQNVPDDFEVFDSQKIVKQLLGGKN